MIRASHLSMSYGPGAAARALDDVSFEVGRGEIVALLGPNGAGKTTLMRILTGFLAPTSGDAALAGLSIHDQSLAARRQVGYLPEGVPLYPDMRVDEYLVHRARLRGLARADRARQIDRALVDCGLVDRRRQIIGTLSRGYRQRVGLADAILARPPILILDEPTVGLDPNQIREVRALVRALAREATVLLSTHILSEVEATCERVLVIMQGALRADAKLAELRNANAAVVAVEAAASGVADVLHKVAGVTSVEAAGTAGDFRRWRVTSGSKDDLCPALFDALRTTRWKIGELRPEPKTLERVFRDLAERSGQVAP
jgi:ABC-2 type transport system ATP-binding protein